MQVGDAHAFWAARAVPPNDCRWPSAAASKALRHLLHCESARAGFHGIEELWR